MNVLVVAPHPDDEIIGAGGTMAKRIAQGHTVYVCIVTKGQAPLHDIKVIEKGREEARAVHRMMGVKDTAFVDAPATCLDTVAQHEINDAISVLIQTLKIDEVYTPYIHDLHLDHRIVTEAVMVSTRPGKNKHNVSRVYCYETMSETGWNFAKPGFSPNVFEDISEHMTDKIVEMSYYQSQLEKRPAARSIDTLTALARFRGGLIGVEAAEAFMLLREVR